MVIISNPDAEKSFLGTVMYCPEELAAVIDDLKPNDFYFDKHRIIFETILKLHSEGLTCDLVTVSGRLYADGNLGKVTASYLTQLYDSHHAVDIAYQGRLVKDAALRRKVFEVGNALSKIGNRTDLGTNDALIEAQKILYTLDHGFKNLDLHAAPLTEDMTRVLGALTERPPEISYLINFQNRGLIPARTVAALVAAGGTGKTKLLIKLAAAAALGESWAHFDFERPIKVLLLCAEEDQDELDRRLWDACGGKFSPELYARSVKGVVGPLMALDGNVPIRTKWFSWLDTTIQNHQGLDLLILDPKSRFYGLNELDNDHNTQWIASLEALSEKYGIAIIFTHHVPKGTDTINQWMSRGGGSLVDACRSVLGMIPMPESEGKGFDLTNWKNYIKIGISKINYGPKDGGDAYLKFDDDGNLKLANPGVAKTHNFKTFLLYLLQKEKRSYSRYELVKKPEAKHIAQEMIKQYPHFSRRRHMEKTIDALLSDGSLVERISYTGSAPKKVFAISEPVDR